MVEPFELLPPVVVLDPVCLAVPEEPVAEPVLEPVFVPDGLGVWVAEEAVHRESVCNVVKEEFGEAGLLGMNSQLLLAELLFCRTTRESNSGNHRGQGHAAVNVESKSRTSE
jgi:hypothetical protein